MALRKIEGSVTHVLDDRNNKQWSLSEIDQAVDATTADSKHWTDRAHHWIRKTDVPLDKVVENMANEVQAEISAPLSWAYSYSMFLVSAFMRNSFVVNKDCEHWEKKSLNEMREYYELKLDTL